MAELKLCLRWTERYTGPRDKTWWDIPKLLLQSRNVVLNRPPPPKKKPRAGIETFGTEVFRVVLEQPTHTRTNEGTNPFIHITFIHFGESSSIIWINFRNDCTCATTTKSSKWWCSCCTFDSQTRGSKIFFRNSRLLLELPFWSHHRKDGGTFSLEGNLNTEFVPSKQPHSAHMWWWIKILIDVTQIIITATGERQRQNESAGFGAAVLCPRGDVFRGDCDAGFVCTGNKG